MDLVVYLRPPPAEPEISWVEWSAYSGSLVKLRRPKVVVEKIAEGMFESWVSAEVSSGVRARVTERKRAKHVNAAMFSALESLA